MGFTASQAVARLDYDFTGLDISSLDGVKGVSPEPSSEQVRRFQFSLRELFNLTGDDDDAANLAKYMSSLSEDELAANDEELVEIYAAVCSNEPSAEQIAALPHRVRQAYIGYLSGELLNPTEGTSVTRRSLAPVKTG